MDQNKHKVMMDYLRFQSLAKTASENGISPYHVKKIVETSKMDANVSALMRKNQLTACNLMDMCLEELTDRERLRGTSSVNLVTILGFLIDRFSKQDQEENSNKIEKIIGEICDE